MRIVTNRHIVVNGNQRLQYRITRVYRSVSEGEGTSESQFKGLPSVTGEVQHVRVGVGSLQLCMPAYSLYWSDYALIKSVSRILQYLRSHKCSTKVT